MPENIQMLIDIKELSRRTFERAQGDSIYQKVLAPQHSIHQDRALPAVRLRRGDPIPPAFHYNGIGWPR